ncbi:hypothetical protein [Streptomyces sp. NPDC060031]|uniref:maltokinase N-terminal cap-like domain-containing protein n=1 Tax=Streptomyces sp. NPDC060031 TaxID=3347043 RepID=UPI0036985F60
MAVRVHRGQEHALVGTMEHGVLGRRWACDGCHDPVLVAQLLALVEGRVHAQDRNTSDTPDREVICSSTGEGWAPGARPAWRDSPLAPGPTPLTRPPAVPSAGATATSP